MSNSRPSVILLGPISPPMGGVAVFSLKLYEVLKEDFNLIFWGYSNRKSPSHSRVIVINHSFFTLLRALWWSPRGAVLLDSSHFFIEYPNKKMFFIFLIFVHFKKIKWIKVFHDGTFPARYPGFSIVNKLIVTLNLKQLSRALAIGEKNEIWLKGMNMRCPVERISPILEVTESSLLNQTETDVFKLPEGEYLISTGAFVPLYGFDQVVKAVELIRSGAHKNINLVLITSSMINDDFFERELLNERPWIHVFCDISPSHVRRLLQGSKALIRSVREESFGLTRIEGLMAGVPVIGTKTGETRGQLLYSFGHPEELCEKIERVLSGDSEPDAQKWASHFMRESQTNATNFKSMVVNLWKSKI